MQEGITIKRIIPILIIACIALAFVILQHNTPSENEHKIHGTVTKISANEVIFEDENSSAYIVLKSDYDFTRLNLKKGNLILVTIDGNILEVSPAKFEKVVDMQKERN